MLPEVFPPLPLDLVQGGGGGVSLVACSVRASSLLSPRFIRGLGILELLSFSELQLLFMSDWLFLLISIHSTRGWGGRVIRSVG